MSAEMIPLEGYERRADELMIDRSLGFLQQARTRRTVREYSSDPVADEVVANCLKTGMTAPSGANQQPWTFVWVQDADIRKQIREAAEAEEREFYGGRAPEEWLDALQPFNTDDHKPFLETAPVLVVVFAEAWKNADGEKKKNYYVSESVGIATGFLIAALHNAGLATLTHTPSPMKFLNSILGRPDNERPYVVLVAGHPAKDCQVPAITKRDFDDVVIRR
ncbi:MAG: nitroreductase family protein [Planctomycetaceae bacterium]|nr:nitroreductase family protein [Planctomycetaceae bacterium]